MGLPIRRTAPGNSAGAQTAAKTTSRVEAGLYVRPPPIDIRYRICQRCGHHKPTKGGSIRVGRGLPGGHFVCADCKPKQEGTLSTPA